MSAAPEFELDEQYNYPVPPPGGWTADDLDRLPNLPRHTELIDGSLVFASPQTAFHSQAMRLLESRSRPSCAGRRTARSPGPPCP
ncbi:hypothetical protein ACFQ6V_33630, partial [Streptomyces roseifaciens]